MERASAILGRALWFVDASEAEWRARSLGGGASAPFADLLFEQLRAVRAVRACVTMIVAELTGRPALRSADWVLDHAALRAT
jgi:hypothetical protein